MKIKPYRDQRRRNKRNTGCIQGEQRTHGWCGGLLIWIERLQLLHRLDSHRCGCIPQTQQIGAHIGQNVTHSGMITRNIREEKGNQRRKQLGYFL